MRATIMYGAGDVRIENVSDAIINESTDARRAGHARLPRGYSEPKLPEKAENFVPHARMLYGDGAEMAGALVNELKALDGGH